MDGLCRVLSSPLDIALANQSFLLLPLTLRFLGMIEQHLLFARRQNLESLQKRLDVLNAFPHAKDRLAGHIERDWKKDATLRRVTQTDLDEFLHARDGQLFSARLCLRRIDGRGISPATVEKLMRDLADEEAERYQQCLLQSSSMDLLSCMDWPDKYARPKWAPPLKIKPKSQPIPWRRLLRFFANEYGWGPAVVGGLTLYHVRLYTAEDDELGGVAAIAGGDAKDVVLARNAAHKFKFRPGEF